MTNTTNPTIELALGRLLRDGQSPEKAAAYALTKAIRGGPTTVLSSVGDLVLTEARRLAREMQSARQRSTLATCPDTMDALFPLEDRLPGGVERHPR